ncbi:MAG: hypothetical protein ACRDNS_31020, partial [Trebonia sp.]
MLATAVLAIELSGDASRAASLVQAAQRFVADLAAGAPEMPVWRRWEPGVTLALSSASTDAIDAVTHVARLAAHARRLAEADRVGGGLELRAGVALGLVDGRDPVSGATIDSAVRLARGAQAGQVLLSAAVA